MWPELESYLDRLVSSGNPPGLSLVVVKDGNIVYNNAFGYADGPNRVKADTDTVYHWWSMTKIPTAIAIMQLREQGKLDLDDAVTEYLPWFDVTYPSETSPVNHRSTFVAAYVRIARYDPCHDRLGAL